MKKLSEIIKTDCYIDCGTNEKLREVYPLIDMPEFKAMVKFGIYNTDILIAIRGTISFKAAVKEKIFTGNKYTHNISEIDLNN